MAHAGGTPVRALGVVAMPMAGVVARLPAAYCWPPRDKVYAGTSPGGLLLSAP
jgi:hypothetical protein